MKLFYIFSLTPLQKKKISGPPWIFVHIRVQAIASFYISHHVHHHESKSKDGFGLEIDDVCTSETST